MFKKLIKLLFGLRRKAKLNRIKHFHPMIQSDRALKHKIEKSYEESTTHIAEREKEIEEQVSKISDKRLQELHEFSLRKIIYSQYTKDHLVFLMVAREDCIRRMRKCRKYISG